MVAVIVYCIEMCLTLWKTCLWGFGDVCALRACQPNYHYAGRASSAPRIDQVGAGELSAHLRRTVLSWNCHCTKLNLSTPPPGAPSGVPDEITTARGVPHSTTLRHKIRALWLYHYFSEDRNIYHFLLIYSDIHGYLSCEKSMTLLSKKAQRIVYS